jgi:hypothetical protein
MLLQMGVMRSFSNTNNQLEEVKLPIFTKLIEGEILLVNMCRIVKKLKNLAIANFSYLVHYRKKSCCKTHKEILTT